MYDDNDDNDDEQNRNNNGLPALNRLETRLLVAADVGDATGLQLALKDGPVNVDCHRRWERLHHLERLATFKSAEESREFYLQWCTPLQLASYRGHLDCVQILLEAGARPDKEHASANMQSNLLIAPKTSCPYADFEAESCGNALHWACLGGSTSVVRALLKSGKGDVDASDMFFRSAMHWAARGGHADVISHTDIRAADFYDSKGCSPVHVAARSGYVDVLRVLEEKKMDLFAPTKTTEGDSSSPTHTVELAAIGLHAAALDFLLQKCAQRKADDRTSERFLETMVALAVRTLLQSMRPQNACTEDADEKIANVADVLVKHSSLSQKSLWMDVLYRAIECDLEKTLRAVATSRFVCLDAESAAELLQLAIKCGAKNCVVTLLDTCGITLCLSKETLSQIEGLAEFALNVILPDNPFAFHRLLAVLHERYLEKVFLQAIQTNEVVLWLLLHDHCKDMDKTPVLGPGMRRTATKKGKHTK